MSTKINALLPAVYDAADIDEPTMAASPVLETLINDYKVSSLQVVQVDDAGRCIVLAGVQVADEPVAFRPIAATSGSVKLYADMGSVFPLIKRAKLQAGADVQFYRKPQSISFGDPLAMLKSQFKAFKAEKLAVDKIKTFIDSRIVATVALGYDTSTNTLERAEYDDLEARRVSTNEAIAYTAGRITSLAASLTAAGIDPAMVA